MAVYRGGLPDTTRRAFSTLCSDIRDRRLHWAEWNGLDGMLIEGETRSVTAEAQPNLRGLAGFKCHLNLLKL